MAPPPAVAMALPADDHDPVWAAALAAPPCTEPIPAEMLEGLEDAIDDDDQIPGEKVHAEVERAVRAMKRFGAAGDAAEVTIAEVLRWLDTGEPSPGIAELLAAESSAAAE